jgi:hypothetical protein
VDGEAELLRRILVDGRDLCPTAGDGFLRVSGSGVSCQVSAILIARLGI